MIDKSILPAHWEVKKLGEVCTVRNGYAFKSVDYKDDGVLLFRQTNLDGENVKFKNAVYLNHSFLISHKDFLIEKGDVIIGMSGSIGKLCTYNLNEPALQNQRTGLLKFSEDVEGKFVRYYFEVLEKEFKEKSKGVAVLNISAKDIHQSEFVCPPLSEQQEIVAKIEELISELDKGKEQLETALKQLKVYRQAVLKWAFEGRFTNSVVKDGELPEGWKRVKLVDICSIIGGVTKGRDFKGKETIVLPYLRVANVQDGYLDLKEIKEIEVLPTDREKYKLVYGDILYTEGGDIDKLGRGTIWKDEVEDCIHQNHIFRARPISADINSKFVAYYSQTKAAKNYFLKHGKQTTNLASINLTVLKNLPLLLPTIEEQNQIVQEIESRLSVCEKVEETITKGIQQAETLRQSILKKAFEGKLVKAGKKIAELA